MNATFQPDDEFNRSLAGHVFPEQHRNPRSSGKYHLVVIGGGTAGLVTASAAAQMGARVALVERQYLGGDCLNAGCVPSKSVIAAARAAAAVRQAARFGIRSPNPQIDFGEVMRQMRECRARISEHDSVRRFEELGVEVFLGEGRFVDANTVVVGDARLVFRRAVVATGTRPAMPPVPGLDSVDFLTNETVFSLTRLPASLGIIGAGPIGCELAQAFSRLGCRVVLVEVASRILARDDAEAANVVARALSADGVTIHTGVAGLSVTGGSSETVLRGTTSAGPLESRVQRLLVAAGRHPVVEGLGLEQAGVTWQAGQGIEVDDFLRTSNPRVFAAGDVCSGYRFTHAADFMARIVLRNALFPFGRARLSRLVIPWCTYTSPELAQVGPTREAARQSGLDVQAVDVPFSLVDRAVLDRESEGFARLLVQRNGIVAGATMVGELAGELLPLVTTAVRNRIRLGELAHTVFAYPTRSEVIRKAADQFNRARLTPRLKQVLQTWMKWTS